MAVNQKSWIASANDPSSDFPIQNLPYGVFIHRKEARVGIAIGDTILDLHACATHGLLAGLSEETIAACRVDNGNPAALNALMSLGAASWSTLRRRITTLLDADQATEETRRAVSEALVPMHEAQMQLPARIGDYTDFYASIHHATRVGKLFRPDNPLLPNYKYVPIGYHGRASSIVISGQGITRPHGQIKPSTAAVPVFGPTHALDYELEVGIFVGTGNRLGEGIPLAEAEQHIFGLCLLNDWSARDIQSWEYQPLGPFLAKNFATTISPWIVPLEALAPYRVPAPTRPDGDPAPLPYLSSPSRLDALDGPDGLDALDGLDGFDLTLDVFLQSAQMRNAGLEPMLLSRGNLCDLYWTIAQLLTHHASNGCNLRPGDLLATGTVSGPTTGSEGCLLEKADPIRLPSGEVRRFLEDGDQVTFRAYAHKAGLPRIGFGECTGTILA
jgi:fumarylacetoacetase